MHEDPRPDDEVVEEQKREEEGLEPSAPVPGTVTEVAPAEESSPPNPGGANYEE